MRKRFAKVLAAITLTSIVGGAIAVKAFPDALGSSLYKFDTMLTNTYSKDSISCNDALDNAYCVKPSMFNDAAVISKSSIDEVTNISGVKISRTYNPLSNFHLPLVGLIDTSQINIWFPNKSRLEAIPNMDPNIDMSPATQTLRRLPKEKFYLEHKDQFNKDSLALLDIVNSLNLYTRVVSKELTLAMMKEESSFFMFPDSSWAGAQGTMQVRRIGWETVETDPYLPNVHNPRRNIIAGIKIAKWLEHYCEKNYAGWDTASLQHKRDLVVTSYNCGIGELIAYADFERAKKDSTYIVERHPWYIDETPRETREYVVKVRNTLNNILNKKISPKKFLAYNKS